MKNSWIRTAHSSSSLTVVKTANAGSSVDGFWPGGKKYSFCIFLAGPKSVHKTATVCSFVNISFSLGPKVSIELLALAVLIKRYDIQFIDYFPAGPKTIHRTASVGSFGNMTAELLALAVLIQDFVMDQNYCHQQF